MIREKNPPSEDYVIRCPRLGHQISFSYCLEENSGLPCFKTLDCWYEHFLVEEYLRGRLTPDQWKTAFEKPGKTKLLSLVDLVRQAKKTEEEKT